MLYNVNEKKCFVSRNRFRSSLFLQSFWDGKQSFDLTH